MALEHDIKKYWRRKETQCLRLYTVHHELNSNSYTIHNVIAVEVIMKKIDLPQGSTVQAVRNNSRQMLPLLVH